ncbi:MAG: hypothetical protein FJ020_00585 [Chloroflexi bacterium]|nr:hypothetical protein [Chloroflexota bacterium]
MRCSVDLALDGKTLVHIWPKADGQAVDLEDELAGAFVCMMGQPQACVSGRSGELVMLFPHQNMPEDVRDIAERMTTRHLIKRLESGVCSLAM